MSDVVIRVEKLSKHYRLGQIGGGTLREDLQTWWAGKRGLPDPTQKVDAKHTSRSGEHWALRDVSFEVRQGEVLGIIGRNGAGKSTLLKILSRTTAPTEGTARLKGRVGSLLEVGTGFHPELTGRENVFLNGAILGMTHAEIAKKFDEILAFAEIENYIDTPVKRYSSGMTVRLAFAVAAHLEPEILIVDEVLAVGDASFQEKCIRKLNDVGRNGRTVIFVSHNHVALQSLCTRAILLAHGVITAEGEINEVLTKYAVPANAASNQRTWATEEAPGSNGIHLSALRSNNSKCNGQEIVNSQPIAIEIDIVSERDADIEVSLLLTHSAGLGAIHSSYSICGSMLRLRPGRQRIAYTLPAGLLNPGNYSLGISAERPGISFFFHEKEALQLRVSANPDDKLPNSMYDAWRSCIQPSVGQWRRVED